MCAVIMVCSLPGKCTRGGRRSKPTQASPFSCSLWDLAFSCAHTPAPGLALSLAPCPRLGRHPWPQESFLARTPARWQTCSHKAATRCLCDPHHTCHRLRGSMLRPELATSLSLATAAAPAPVQDAGVWTAKGPACCRLWCRRGGEPGDGGGPAIPHRVHPAPRVCPHRHGHWPARASPAGEARLGDMHAEWHIQGTPAPATRRQAGAPLRQPPTGCLGHQLRCSASRRALSGHMATPRPGACTPPPPTSCPTPASTGRRPHRFGSALPSEEVSCRGCRGWSAGVSGGSLVLRGTGSCTHNLSCVYRCMYAAASLRAASLASP